MPPQAATKQSLRQHPVPDWFEDDKLGIFIHWGLFSIPAFAPRLREVSDAFTQHYRLSSVMTPYTEWYWNATRVPESPSAAHHRERWADRPYADFRADFARGLEQWDPKSWAKLFRRAGARYVVLVTKHHDGYCLWPSRVANPRCEGWTSERDIVGELADAVRAEGLRFGVYYSGGIDWTFNTTPVRTLVQFIGSVPDGPYPAYADAQVRELIERYSPSVLWNDIAWPSALQPMLDLMAHYYDAVPEGVINDRWMHVSWALRLLRLAPVQRLADALLERQIKRADARGEYTGGIIPPPPVHYDFRTPEYTRFDDIQQRKWEATRGMSASFGFNEQDCEEDYASAADLLHGFIDSVSKNGNLLLNVGPRGVDAGIPEPQQARLEEMGRWLSHSGEAIYGTRPADVAEGSTREGLPVRYTEREGVLYATVLGSPDRPEVTLSPPDAFAGALEIRRLRDDARISDADSGSQLRLPLGDDFECEPAHAFALRPL